MRTRQSKQKGVGLVVLLLAIAALVAAIVLGQGMSGIGKRSGEFAANQASFEALHVAITQFVMLNRRLPCPAAGTASTGLENVVSPTDTAVCQSPSGVVPWVALGLPQSAATDSWGRMIGYRVFDQLAGFTRTNGLNLTDCLDEDVVSVVALSGGVCNATTHENTRSDFFVGKGVIVNDKGTAMPMVGYVLISFGETGLGAYIPTSAMPMEAPSGASKEFQNAGSGGTYWILAQSGPNVPADDDNHFDDVVSYKVASDVATAAKIGGRPWHLSALLDRANVTVGGVYNTSSATAKATSTTGEAMTITAAADTSRNVCVVSGPPEGVAPCIAISTSGADNLRDVEGERLTFEFRVKRRHLKIKLSEFRLTGGNAEKALITFYDGATQIFQVEKDACDTGANANGEFTLDPGAEFTRVEVRARDASISSEFSIRSIAACKYTDAALCSLRESGTSCS